MQVMKYVASQKKPEVLLGNLLPEEHLKVKSKGVIKKIIDVVSSEVWPSSETIGSFQTASLRLYKEPSCPECLFWWVVPRYVESLAISQVETKQHFHMTEAPVSRGDDRTSSCRHSTIEIHSNTGEQGCSVDLQFFRFWRIQTLNTLHLKTLKHLFRPASAERTSWRSDGDDNENQDDWSLIDSVIIFYFNINEMVWMMLTSVIIL